MRNFQLRLHSILIATALLLLAAGCIRDDEPEEWSLQPGDPLPQISLLMSDGTTITNRELEGKRSAIIFFNTSCRDCRRELPVIQKAMEENPGVEFICVAREEGMESIEAFWKEHDLTLPYSPQADRAVYNKFASTGIPRVYLVSPQLIITAVYVETLSEQIQW